MLVANDAWTGNNATAFAALATGSGDYEVSDIVMECEFEQTNEQHERSNLKDRGEDWLATRRRLTGRLKCVHDGAASGSLSHLNDTADARENRQVEITFVNGGKLQAVIQLDAVRHTVDSNAMYDIEIPFRGSGGKVATYVVS